MNQADKDYIQENTIAIETRENGDTEYLMINSYAPTLIYNGRTWKADNGRDVIEANSIADIHTRVRERLNDCPTEVALCGYPVNETAFLTESFGVSCQTMINNDRIFLSYFWERNLWFGYYERLNACESNQNVSIILQNFEAMKDETKVKIEPMSEKEIEDLYDLLFRQPLPSSQC